MLESKLFLPFDSSATLFNYYIGFPHAIVKANSRENYDLAVSDMYINCFYQHRDGDYNFYYGTHNYWYGSQGVMTYQQIDLSLNSLSKFKAQLHRWFIKIICSEAYIFCTANRKFFESDYNEIDIPLNILISGYDLESGIFLVHGFDSLNKVFTKEISFEKLIDSILNIRNTKNHIHIWKYNKDKKCSLNIKKIRDDVGDYLSSICSAKIPQVGKTYGLSAIEKLKEYFISSLEEGKVIENYYIQAFVEHKAFMKKRIELLSNEGLIQGNYLQSSEYVSQIACELFDSITRVNCSREPSLVHNTNEAMREIVSIETEYLTKTMIELKNKDRILSIN